MEFLRMWLCLAKQLVNFCGHNINFLKILPILLFREIGREGEKEGEKYKCARDTGIGCLSHTRNRGPGLKPRHVPWLGIDLVPFRFTGQCSIHRATPARAKIKILKHQRHLTSVNFLSLSHGYQAVRLGHLSTWSPPYPNPTPTPDGMGGYSYREVPSKAFSFLAWEPGGQSPGETWRMSHLPHKALGSGDPSQAVGLWQ